MQQACPATGGGLGPGTTRATRHGGVDLLRIRSTGEIRPEEDVIRLSAPDPFVAISVWYRSFPQITDDEVREILTHASSEEATRHDTPA